MTKQVRAPTNLYRVQLQDELPAIGSGHRWVFAREGTKWAFILDPFTVTTAKVRIAAWRGIKRERVPHSTYIINHMRHRLVLLNRAPTAFERTALEAR